ncbi:16S rRNA (adenine(1518)-N(6)/adenine(1519)-N(6))-dimethyltransferase RsmA [Candidatus Nanohalobium constans]|uniref:16S rRNA (Adenine1518-N6/adenine1519-N6)-dimethyltransferase n=1 Tax=Candidatus Nanohalobium constans TaxID=2565781 RepID=A0A5Q0UFF1_9ARCH|nr:16S rRNA (adenine(1518)-N(6)/adenine(1519)-N(6))-dimethyltransferase RsmA [Candidatus Nanohalobium constans]QGA80343.1 16S rRNA (adenine1518-N6/adenine1519-N6)-dimethyltransferase [Candidatus Nanohalobium constans]
MEIEEKLQEIGVQPGKGQNFLRTDSTAAALAQAGEIDGEKTLEIGPGTGMITEKLAEKTDDLILVERNGNLANYIKKEFPEAEVLKEDFLEIELEEMEIERVVSNIPFEISSDIIEKLGKAQMQSALIVQDELADKLVAEPSDKNYGFFTVKAQYYFVPVKLRTLSSRTFYPEPEVDAAIVKLYPNKDRHPVEDEEAFFDLVKALFTHKRKKLRNAFVDTRHMLDYEKEEAKAIRDELPHSEERVINLDIKQLAEVAEFLEER